jgi:multidrug efflux pump subunit AcrB
MDKEQVDVDRQGGTEPALYLHRAALLVLILGTLTIVKTAKDIFPNIGISVIWTYTSMPPHEIRGRITGSFERVSRATANNINHIESQSLNGVSVPGDSHFELA